MANAFLTGSRVYGTPRDDSDLDFVVLVTPDTLDRMREFLGEYRGDLRYLGQHCSASLRFGDLNIIATTDEATFNAWKQSTEILEGRKPVTRDAAVGVVKALLATIHTIHDHRPKHKPKPQLRLPAPG